jgi:hypothetical protein
VRGFRCDRAPRWRELTPAGPSACALQLIEPLCVARSTRRPRRPAAGLPARDARRALQRAPGRRPAAAAQRLTDLLPRPRAMAATTGATLRTSTRWSASVASRRLGRRRHAVRRVVLATTAVEAARLVAPLAPEWRAAAAAALRADRHGVRPSEGTRLPQPMLRLPSTLATAAQFVFDQGQLGGRAACSPSSSAGRNRGSIAACEATRRRRWHRAIAASRGICAARCSRARTDRETRHFRCVPSLRAPAATSRRAAGGGDYVEGPYPATIEGAVRAAWRPSGRLDASGARTARPAARPRTRPAGPGDALPVGLDGAAALRVVQQQHLRMRKLLGCEHGSDTVP